MFLRLEKNCDLMGNSDYEFEFSDPKNITIYGFYVISILFIFFVNLCNSNWYISDTIDRKKTIEC